MNWAELLQQEPWPGLMKALVHSLWQGALIAVLLHLILRFLPTRKTNLRYVLCLAAMGVLFFVTSATWRITTVRPPAVRMDAPAVESAEPVAEPVVTFESVDDIPMTEAEPEAEQARQTPWMAWGAAAWLVGVLLMSGRIGISVLGAWRLRRSCKRLEDGPVQALAEEARGIVGISRRVALVVSERIKSPVVIGAFWPTLLLPVAMITNLSPDQLRVILAHELAHVRRYDYVINLLQMIVDALFFFNPALWWISSQVRNEREACCDAMALAAGGSRADYAAALLAVGHKGTVPSVATGFGSGSRHAIIDRFHRILKPAAIQKLRLPWYSLVMGFLLSVVLLAGLACSAQKAADITAKAFGPERVESNCIVSGQKGNLWYFYTPKAGEFQFAIFYAEGRVILRHRFEEIGDDFFLEWDEIRHPVIHDRKKKTLTIDGKKHDLGAGRVFHLRMIKGQQVIEQKAVDIKMEEVRSEDASALLYWIQKACVEQPPVPTGEFAKKTQKILEEAGITEESLGPAAAKDARITFSVTAEKGQPAPPKARVSFQIRSSGMPNNTQDGVVKDGVFSKKVAPGVAYCTIHAPGYAPILIDPFHVNSGKHVKVAVRLHRGFEGVLKLVDARGVPVRGAQLRGSFVHKKSQNNLNYSAEIEGQSDKDGLVRIPHSIEKPLMAYFTAPGYQYDRIDTMLVPGATVRAIVKVARPTTGVVVAPATGKPIPGAEVTVVHGDEMGRVSSRLRFRAVSDRNGRFSLNDLRDDKSYVLAAFAEGFGPALIQSARGGQQGLKAELGPILHVKGRILGNLSSLRKTTRRGIWRPSVYFSQTLKLNRSNAGGVNSGSTDVTIRDGVGHFEIKRYKSYASGWPGKLYPGTLDIWVGKRCYKLKLEKSIDDFVIDLSKPQWPTRLFVLKLKVPKGAPKPEGIMNIRAEQLDGSSRWVDGLIKNGEVRLDIPVPCRVAWWPKKMLGYWLSRESGPGREVASGEKPFVVEAPLLQAGMVHGEFLDTDGRPPQDGLGVSLLVVTPPPGVDPYKISDYGGMNYSRDRGRFASLPIPLGGTYRLVGGRLRGGARLAVSPTFTLTKDAPIKKLRLQISDKAVSQRIKVLMPDGITPAVGVDVSWSCFNAAQRKIKTNQAGEVVLNRLNLEGEYEISVGGHGTDVDFIYKSQLLTLNGELTVIRTKMGKRITGIVLDDATGNPVKGVWVGVTAMPSGKRGLGSRKPTNEKGEFLIRGLPDGKYHLTGTTYDRIPHKKTAIGECVAVAGQAERVIIRLTPVKE
jgi:beta-lactamase regulating signal transducer with metallopeptidase domain